MSKKGGYCDFDLLAVIICFLIFLGWIMYAISNNAIECIFASDTMTCIQIKKGFNK